jgi:hypothetical protein
MKKKMDTVVFLLKYGYLVYKGSDKRTKLRYMKKRGEYVPAASYR